MTTDTKKSLARIVARWSIVGLVLVGTLLISRIADVSPGTSMTTRAFFFFLGAVIVVQVIPGLMLLGAMLKAIYGLISKRVKVHAKEPMN